MNLAVAFMLIGLSAYCLGHTCKCECKEKEKEKPLYKPPADPPTLEDYLRQAHRRLYWARWFGGEINAEQVRADIVRLEAEKEIRNAAIRRRILGSDPHASCPIANEAQATLARLEADRETQRAAIRRRILGSYPYVEDEYV